MKILKFLGIQSILKVAELIMNLVTNLLMNRLQMKSTATKAGFEIREKSNTCSKFVHDEIFSWKIFEEKRQFVWTKVTN